MGRAARVWHHRRSQPPKSHIRKEEEIFFPAALKVLTKKDWAEISEVREIRDDPIFGPNPHERLETLREDIRAWSGVTGT